MLGFIGAGHFVRPWRDYGLTWSVLQWLQYLTQVTLKHEMGSIAGDLKVPVWDISYRYRFFIWIDSKTPFRITGSRSSSVIGTAVICSSIWKTTQISLPRRPNMIGSRQIG